MKSKLSKQTQFGERVGIHSLTGFARGFAELLPPQALGYEFQRRSLKEIQDTLCSEIRRLNRELGTASSDGDRKRLTDSLNVAKGRLGFCAKELADCRSKTYAEVFSVVAQIWLNDETYHYLNDMTHSILKHVHMVDRPSSVIVGNEETKQALQSAMGK